MINFESEEGGFKFEATKGLVVGPILFAIYTNSFLNFKFQWKTKRKKIFAKAKIRQFLKMQTKRKCNKMLGK